MNDTMSTETPWTLIRGAKPPEPEEEQSLNVVGALPDVRAHYAKLGLVALPRSLWPRTVMDVTSSPSRWGGAGFVFVTVERSRTDASGKVVTERELDAVYVQQPRPASTSNTTAPVNAISPNVHAFVRGLAARLAKEWAREALRQSGQEVSP